MEAVLILHDYATHKHTVETVTDVWATDRLDSVFYVSFYINAEAYKTGKIAHFGLSRTRGHVVVVVTHTTDTWGASVYLNFGSITDARQWLQANKLQPNKWSKLVQIAGSNYWEKKITPTF